MSDEISQEAARAIARSFESAQEWLERTSRPSEPVDPASELGVDDAATGPKCLSHLAVASLNAAVDHFHAARTLFADVRVFYGNAQFTLLRAALENAATAVYMLVPDDRETRILRALRVAWSDVNDQHSLIDTMRENAQRRGTRPIAEPKNSKSAWKGRLQKIARDRGMSDKDVAQVAAGLPYSVIVRDASKEALGQDLGELALVCWKINSGSTHGKQWEAITKVDRSTLQPTDDPAVSQGRTLPSEDQLHISVAIAKKMIEAGWTLLDTRRAA
ncbi:hypothetical protein [Lentzea flaviverrucosa]|uniref:hypothetical protein n=1 Tax=Lentzea flaviverrucosa TaxID=200379 RepID=UPI0011601D78|nr:hypothetical protein [Lentzea flaviverrucosa]